MTTSRAAKDGGGADGLAGARCAGAETGPISSLGAASLMLTALCRSVDMLAPSQCIIPRSFSP
jgi:hypothetical protein